MRRSAAIRSQRTTMAVVAARQAGAHARRRPVERFGVATLVRCPLDTGRTHQIRVHLAAIGHPLVGDPAYGARRSAAGVPPFARQALHAARLGSADPATRRRACVRVAAARRLRARCVDDAARKASG